MCAGRTDDVDDQVLQPIPLEQFEELLQSSKLQAPMREAIRRVCVPEEDEQGLPMLNADGELDLLTVSEAAKRFNVSSANLSKAVKDIQKKFNQKMRSEGRVPVYGAVSQAYFKTTRVYQRECIEAQSAAAKKPRRKKAPLNKPTE